jgi:hypothetical protein
MSGCHEPIICSCFCHINGIKSMLTSMPPQPCCYCGICEHQQENPWGNKCYFCKLENRISDLEKTFEEELWKYKELQK